MRRALAFLASAPLLAAGAYGAGPTAPPHLVVVVSIDQIGQEFFDRFGQHLPEDGGFRRLIDGGVVYTDAHYEYATTYTGPGHAVQLTGAYGNVNGIVGNAMYVQERGDSFDPVADPRYHLVGATGYGSSPWTLESPTLGDVLIEATEGKAKVIAIALKDRASVLQAGKKGTAYWFDEDTGRFVTSQYYLDELPSWVQAWNESRIPFADYGKLWTRKGPDAAYEGLVDKYYWEGDWDGYGRTMPAYVIGKDFKPNSDFYGAWATSPYGLYGQLELVKSAVQVEGLGKDDVPDILGISFSGFDYVGHEYGPYSYEVASMFFEMDQVIGQLLTFLDEQVGAGRYTLALTGDHGAAPIPEMMVEKGQGGGRIKQRKIERLVDDALTKAFGGGDWVAATEAPFVSLNHALIDKKGIQRVEAERVAADALRDLEGVERVVTRTEIEEGTYEKDELGLKISRSYYPERSGEVVVITKPYWIWGKYGEKYDGATHGSPWSYDTHVPLLLYGHGIGKGRVEDKVELVDLAPTLAGVLGIDPPTTSVGRVLAAAPAESESARGR